MWRIEAIRVAAPARFVTSSLGTVAVDPAPTA